MHTAPGTQNRLLGFDDILNAWEYSQPGKLAIQVLNHKGEAQVSLTYRDLNLKIRAFAACLRKNIAPGEKVILLYPAGADFVVSFLGCLSASVIPIPVPAPDGLQTKRAWPRLLSIMNDAKASYILSLSSFETKLKDASSKSQTPPAQLIFTDVLGEEISDSFEPSELEPTDLAYLQYTSGSQSAPKGVQVSHLNLMLHLADLAKALEFKGDSKTLNWMPHHHDYGLVQGLLLPIFAGGSCYIMAPSTFLRNPMRWITAISEFRITHSQATNFAYSYCLNKYDARQAKSLDLSSWKVAGIGAEPINPNVVRRFQQKFLSHGLNPTAISPAYGLAEATLVVTTKRPSIGVNIQGFEARALRNNKVVKTENQTQRSIVSCGPALSDDTVVRIVDPETKRVCAENEVGEIWVRSPSVSIGHTDGEETNRYAFNAQIEGRDEFGFLRTGDLGFLFEGELFVTDRYKDLIVIRGENHHPKDIDFAVSRCHPALHNERCAAFSIPGYDTEELVVVLELRRSLDVAVFEELVVTIKSAIYSASELRPHAIVFINSGSLPVTSSGKVQRQLCRTQFLGGELDIVYEHRDPRSEPFVADEKGTEDVARRERLGAEIGGKSSASRPNIIRDYVILVLQEILKAEDLSWIPEEQNLLELGIESVDTVEIYTLIEEDLNIKLPMDTLYKHHHLNEFILYLADFFVKEAHIGEPIKRIKGDILPIEKNYDLIDSQERKSKLIDWTVTDKTAEFDLTASQLPRLPHVTMPLKKSSVKKKGMRHITDDWTPKDPFIKRDSNVVGMGSCFTRDIILWLAETGYNRQFPDSPYNALLRYPAIGNNAYLAQQFETLRSLTVDALESETETNDEFLDADKDGGVSLFRLLKNADVLLLTLGTTEVWYDNRTNSALKAPLLLSEHNNQFHSLKLEGYKETRKHLRKIVEICTNLFPHLKIIFTLPIGRMASFCGLSSANAASIRDATLKSAVSEFLYENRHVENLFYFPAFELFTQFFDDPYREDNIHATSYVTGRMCMSFSAMFCSQGIQEPSPNSLDEYDPYFSEFVGAALQDEDDGSGNQEFRATIEALEKRNEVLQQACDERMVVIEKLDAAVRDLKEKHRPTN